ncbi:hypothetical protein K439DRAFT_1547902 [Ramaria rubella]|nr:hypothetical protein K439DRAFT_1547902 [Ramaria rubella]
MALTAGLDPLPVEGKPPDISVRLLARLPTQHPSGTDAVIDESSLALHANSDSLALKRGGNIMDYDVTSIRSGTHMFSPQAGLLSSSWPQRVRLLGLADHLLDKSMLCLCRIPRPRLLGQNFRTRRGCTAGHMIHIMCYFKQIIRSPQQSCSVAYVEAESPRTLRCKPWTIVHGIVFIATKTVVRWYMPWTAVHGFAFTALNTATRWSRLGASALALYHSNATVVLRRCMGIGHGLLSMLRPSFSNNGSTAGLLGMGHERQFTPQPLFSNDGLMENSVNPLTPARQASFLMLSLTDRLCCCQCNPLNYINGIPSIAIGRLRVVLP